MPPPTPEPRTEEPATGQGTWSPLTLPGAGRGLQNGAAARETIRRVPKKTNRQLPGGAVVRTLCLHSCGTGSIPGRGTEIPQGHAAKIKKKKDKHRLPRELTTPLPGTDPKELKTSVHPKTQT